MDRDIGIASKLTSIGVSELPPPEYGKNGWPWTENSQFDIKAQYETFEWPKISIITPSFNQGPFIEETIRSVLLQNYPNLEYIVVDGGSTDETLHILKKYANFIRWISEPDEGQTDAINKGIMMSSGEIIAYINSDDLYEPGSFGIISDLFSANPDITMIYGDITHINEKSEYIEYCKTGEIDIESYLMGIPYLPQPSVFFRRDVIRKIGYFDKTLHLAMDYDYWLKIFFNFKAMYYPRGFAKARIYPEAKSSSMNYKYLDERLRILKQVFLTNRLESSQKKKVFAYVHFVGALVYLKYGFFTKGIKHLVTSLSMDYHYLFNPHLYWAMVEILLGFSLSGKIKPRIKSLFHVNGEPDSGLYYYPQGR
jgi:glycosyltransferase involved in cell wall biosynthesis